MQSLWNLISSTFEAAWVLLSAIFIFLFEALSTLHFDYPRIEGLLVGILLAWLLSRRESHPLIKAASSPLKLILDILDLAWDKGTGSVLGLVNIVKSWILKSYLWCSSKVKYAYTYVMKKLNIIKDDLEK